VCIYIQSRMQYLIPGSQLAFYTWTIVAKRKQVFWAEIGAKRPNYTKIALYGDHRLVRIKTVLVNSTFFVQYGLA
jgi:hypothetical protein